MNTLEQSNRSPAGKQGGIEQSGKGGILPEFLLSFVSPCIVELVPNVGQQTQPSKTKAELLADGQCEV